MRCLKLLAVIIVAAGVCVGLVMSRHAFHGGIGYACDHELLSQTTYVVAVVMALLYTCLFLFLARLTLNSRHTLEQVLTIGGIAFISAMQLWETALECRSPAQQWILDRVTHSSIALIMLLVESLVRARCERLNSAMGFLRASLFIRRLWQLEAFLTALYLLGLAFSMFALPRDESAPEKITFILLSVVHTLFSFASVVFFWMPLPSLRRLSRASWASRRESEVARIYWLAVMQLASLVVKGVTFIISSVIYLMLSGMDPVAREAIILLQFHLYAVFECAVVVELSGLYDHLTKAGRKRFQETIARQERHANWRLACQPDEDEDVTWQEAVQSIALRGLSIKQLMQFYIGLPKVMPHFRPDVHTTADVVRGAIIPMTASDGCAYASMVAEGTPVRPQNMVTHNWSNLFAHLVAAVVADALQLSDFALVSYLLQNDITTLEKLFNPEDLEKTYWICAFSVNQHVSMCSREHKVNHLTGDVHPACKCGKVKQLNDTPPLARNGKSIQCEMNKFEDMMHFLAASDDDFEQVVAVDAAFNIFSRAWCVAEIAQGNRMGITQKVKIHSKAALEKGLGSLQNQHIQIQNMKAARIEDAQEILSRIPDVEAFNAYLQEMLIGGDGLIAALLKPLDFVESSRQIGRLSRIANTVSTATLVASDRLRELQLQNSPPDVTESTMQNEGSV